jgi:hypothetical protein
MKDVRKKGGVFGYCPFIMVLWVSKFASLVLQICFLFGTLNLSYQLQIFWLDSFSGKCAALANLCVVRCFSNVHVFTRDVGKMSQIQVWQCVAVWHHL